MSRERVARKGTIRDHRGKEKGSHGAEPQFYIVFKGGSKNKEIKNKCTGEKWCRTLKKTENPIEVKLKTEGTN